MNLQDYINQPEVKAHGVGTVKLNPDEVDIFISNGLAKVTIKHYGYYNYITEKSDNGILWTVEHNTGERKYPSCFCLDFNIF